MGIANRGSMDYVYNVRIDEMPHRRTGFYLDISTSYINQASIGT